LNLMKNTLCTNFNKELQHLDEELMVNIEDID